MSTCFPVMGRSRRTIGKKGKKPTFDDSRISSLPDCLLVSILDLLPTKTAVSTSVLSYRWQHLWTQLSRLSITGPSTPEYKSDEKRSQLSRKLNNFLTTVDRIMSHLTSPKIHKFELIMGFPRYFCSSNGYDSLVYSWVDIVCSRYPEDFSVILSPFDYCYPIEIPACIFRCDTIVSLNLSDGLVYKYENEINLPNLKKLGMVIKDWHSHRQLFKSCPLLEDLCLKLVYDKNRLYEEDVHVAELVCPNLKSLDLYVRSDDKMIEFVIDALMLEKLSIRFHGAWLRFVDKPSGLGKCELGIWWRYDYEPLVVDFIGRVYEAFKAISSVRSLNLIGVIIHYSGFFHVRKSMPVFHYLTELKISGSDFLQLGSLFMLLKYCPNLEVLVLNVERKKSYYPDINEEEELEELDFEPACLFTKLRVLELNDRQGSINYLVHLYFIEYMLSQGIVLEKVLVAVFVNYSGHGSMVKDSEFCHKLFSYPRKSSVCEINFSGEYITATSKGFNGW